MRPLSCRTILPLLVVGIAAPAQAQSNWANADQEKKAAEEIEAQKAVNSPASTSEAAPASTEAQPLRESQEEEVIDPSERSPIDGVKGHVGIGYFTDFAPLGMRYWLSRGMALDVGLDGSFSSGNLQGFAIGGDLGLVFALAHYHYAVAILRIGAGYRMNQITGPHSTGARHDIIANAFLGVELFLGAFGFPNVSLQGGYGLQAAWAVEGGTNFVIGTSDPSLNVVSSGAVGFHIYL